VITRTTANLLVIIENAGKLPPKVPEGYKNNIFWRMTATTTITD